MNDMKINKAYIAVGLVIAFALFFEVAAHAGESDQATTMSFSQPIQVPGQVLPAGTYVFKIADHGTEPNVVQIFNADRTVFYGTFLTISAQRPEPTDDSIITVAEPESGGIPTLVKWFYPGRDIGNEFLYSKQTEKELAGASQQTIVTGQKSMSNSESTGAGN
jgi:hypothetical protein